MKRKDKHNPYEYEDYGGMALYCWAIFAILASFVVIGCFVALVFGAFSLVGGMQ